MGNTLPHRAAHPDLSARVEVRIDPTRPKANAVPLIAKLLRQIRDRERAEAEARGEIVDARGAE
jgi:hypothetical protein